MSRITHSIHNLLRPTVNEVKVVLYENNQLKDIASYDEMRQAAILEALETMWKAPRGSACWFEAELHQRTSCFRKYPLEIVLCCYQAGKTNPTSKKKANLPIRFRSKFLDKTVPLVPPTVGTLSWPPMEVKFRLVAS